MQKFYIKFSYIPEQDRPDNVGKDKCFAIHLPDKCQHCNALVMVGKVGDINTCGNLKSDSNNRVCNHFIMWHSLWANRIKKWPEAIDHINVLKTIDPLDDGCKCNKCGLFYSMAAPNQIDNTFKCYTCRNRGW